MKIEINNIDELQIFANRAASQFRLGDVILLEGNLGAGKTTFAQFACAALGITEYITSPTFSLVNIYYGKYTVYHLDLYRLKTQAEIETIDYEESFYPEGITFIEWGQNASDYLPDQTITLRFNIVSDTKRILEIEGNNSREIEFIEGLQ